MKTRTTRNTAQPSESDPTSKLSRRKFLKGGLVAAASASVAASIGPPTAAAGQPGGPATPGGDVATEQTLVRAGLPGQGRANRPNILIILCDEMRFPPSYESDLTTQWRQDHLEFQNTLLANGLNFRRHYIMSAACVPSRASVLTGHYPSLHGTSQTYAGAKEACDPDVFWLDPNSVPTFGNYFRAAGYLTFWIGKWHISNADMLVPGTHDPLPSFDPRTGARDPVKEKLYRAANRLDPYGFAGWIGPEAHGGDPIRDTGSSVPSVKPGQPVEYRGRDISFAEQATELIQELDAHPNSAPWLVVCSFVNPHDIGLYGMFTQPTPGHPTGFEFTIDESLDPPIPAADDLFTPDFYELDGSLQEDLANNRKPKAQVSYRDSYHVWMNPVLDGAEYSRYYYQLHYNVDQQMKTVFDALQATKHYKDNTIVVFTSDHGEMLLAHGYMHQKMYQAYEETTRVPLMIWYPKAISKGEVHALTSHADLAPTLLGLAGIDSDQIDQIRQALAVNHSDVLPFVGRDLSPLILGQDFNEEPVFFMTDDDASRGLHMIKRDGVGYFPVEQPNHVETVIARLDDGDGHPQLWKFSRYFDNQQYWSSPDTPEDVLKVQTEKDPAPTDPQPTMIPFETTAKATPVGDEFEMYKLTGDPDDPDVDRYPMELDNLYGNPIYEAQQKQLANLLDGQRAQKRLSPISGKVPGQ